MEDRRPLCEAEGQKAVRFNDERRSKHIHGYTCITPQRKDEQFMLWIAGIMAFTYKDKDVYGCES